MRLSEYAKQKGVTYKTAYRWFKAGGLDAYQLNTGTIIVNDDKIKPDGVAIYARVSSLDQKDDLERQVERLQSYTLSRGYQITSIVKEIASGLNDSRPKLTKLLQNQEIGIIVVEHKDRLTRFGFNYIETLLACQNRKIEVVFPDVTKDDLVDDFATIITSMSARIYGKRGNKKRAKQILDCIENVESNTNPEK